MLDMQSKQFAVNGLLDTGAVVSVMSVSLWTDLGYDMSDLVPNNNQLAAVIQENSERKYDTKSIDKIKINQARIKKF